MIDDRLRSAAEDIRVEAANRVPPPLRDRPRRVAPIAAGGLIIVALVVGTVLYSIRHGEPSPATDKRVSHASTTAPLGTAVPATSVPSPPTTTTPISAATIEQVSSQELSSFIGTYEIDYRDANLTLGQVGTSELAIEMTSHSFCLRFVEVNSSSCRNAADGSTLPTRPESLSTLVASSELSAAAPLISVAIIAPNGVDLSVLNGDQRACALQQFPLPQFGSAVVWACQARGPTDNWELAATKAGRTLAAPTLSAESGDVPQTNVVRFVGPEEQFSVELPASFAPQGDGMIQGGGDTFPNHFVYTRTFVDVNKHARITLSVERGVVAADAITSGSTPTMAYDDVRPGVTVLARVDPASKDTAMWWPADATSVAWLYGSGLTEDQLLAVLASIEVAPA